MMKRAIHIFFPFFSIDIDHISPQRTICPSDFRDYEAEIGGDAAP
jgi:hypothetical protein